MDGRNFEDAFNAVSLAVEGSVTIRMRKPLEDFIKNNNVEPGAIVYINDEKMRAHQIAGNYAMRTSSVESYKYTSRGLEITTDYN